MAAENFTKSDGDSQSGLELMIGHQARTLTPEETAKLDKDQTLVSEFKQRKFELDAQKNWDLFYKRNTTKFFKDRHWTKREFSELISEKQDYCVKTVLEVGCGVGNFIFPLLEEDKNLYFHACDFSKRAVEFVKSHPQYDAARCNAFQCDLTADDLRDNVPPDTVDAVSMIFVLSAIHPDKMLAALHNVFQVTRPGGCILFRDYGLYDYAMLRFAPGHKLSDHFYVRQDGTRAYYFSLEKLEGMMTSAGFTVSRNEYVKRETVNKKEGICVPRIFVQGKFVKPIATSVDTDKQSLITSTNSDNTPTLCEATFTSTNSQDTLPDCDISDSSDKSSEHIT
ncbi:tRNA N(3)-methylcytidine methyltransferase METTL6-like [Haliotis rubra]|uniref:tRNA N(3)-methylcytidine methyltransferase METTL6-like n=1 Tax=Haliotis rubra TaxID=36100 RepID=UPI001EE5CBF5|nr:tRNA N(3)-methylcytidine methyltransferase METTL6-like [Haliotis rubra]XP_046543223.1 tRNA N(3)-methylcytidine methyltransferase METTL6-like [Haliotis rubra]XP_046543225.1 tRNA N(3)-methylcytidine methyltransferase METTL6-like [Haliotis rubra]XP_046543226.1 tRNA N(3)-methylcytidine methyltransferase METTL6-like [Haliotis rubra]